MSEPFNKMLLTVHLKNRNADYYLYCNVEQIQKMACSIAGKKVEMDLFMVKSHY